MSAQPEDISRAVRQLWLRGDWPALQAQELDALAAAEDRAELALMVAAGHFHQPDQPALELALARAREWGASAAQAAAVLTSGVENTLGRMALVAGDTAGATAHFAAAMSTMGAPVAPDGLETRRLGQLLEMGALDEAAEALAESYGGERRGARVDTARMRVFETELDLLKHELSLTLKLRLSAPQAATRDGDVAAWARAHSVSQLGQDLWVLEQTGYKRGGFFVEIGAADGVLLSNGYLLETGFGWDGLCAEPNPDFYEKARQNRRCTVAKACIAGETGREVEFITAGVYGGLAAYSDGDMHKDKRTAYADSGGSVTLTTVSLDDFLRQHDAPRVIDYLSIDTEGSEHEILAAFPFEDWDIRLITVEHNFTEAREKIHDLLSVHGYLRREERFEDWYYKPSVEAAPG